MNIAETYAKRKRLLRKIKSVKGGGGSLTKGKVTYHYEGVITQLLYAWVQPIQKSSNITTEKHENGLTNSLSQIYNVDESGMKNLAVWYM